MTIHYEDDTLKLQVFVSGFANNAWLLTAKNTGESIIIDTPGDPDELLAASAHENVTGVLITHNHWDHLDGFHAVLEAHPVPVGIGLADAPAVEKLGVSPSIDVSHDALIPLGDLQLRAIATPGHTPGSTCYYLQGAGRRVFSGDTLFPGGPGRTGSPANLKQIVESISTRLLTLPDDTVVHPGHGAGTTIAVSKVEYAVFASKPHPDNLAGDVAWLAS